MRNGAERREPAVVRPAALTQRSELLAAARARTRQPRALARSVRLRATVSPGASNCFVLAVAS